MDRFFSWKHLKFLIILASSVLGMLILKKSINDAVSNFLILPDGALSSINIWLILIPLLVFVIYCIHLFVSKKYRVGHFSTYCLIFLIALLIVLRFTEYSHGWNFIEYKSSGFYYVDFLIVAIFIYLTGVAYCEWWYRFGKNKIQYDQTPFINDLALENEELDLLNYKKRATYITDLLNKSNFKSAFNIAIVGPWGNGKSSLIRLIENELDGKLNQPLKPVHFKFLPTLNHNEVEIISEFFDQLFLVLKEYDGSLANQLLSYSNKLIQLYKTKELGGLFNSTRFKSNQSSYQLYQEINQVLEKIDQKFIVFIDDLDRLSASETLQVLKLIRNTANFRNFIFIVALDKDYVLRTLISKDEILDHTYLDKFFQLEIYLPQVDTDMLKEYFLEIIKSSNNLRGKLLTTEVQTALSSHTDLFEDYITDFRAVKRLANQVIFDYPIIPDELSTDNFLNFTYLKMTFPGVIKFLYENWNVILDVDDNNNMRRMKKAKIDNKNQSAKGWSNSGFSIKRKFVPNFNYYQLTKTLEEYFIGNNGSGYTNQQYILIKKSLIVLFGKENPAVDYTSIQYGDNLRKLLLQDTKKDNLSNREFRELLTEKIEEDKLLKLSKENKLQEVVDRIKFYNPDTIEKTNKVLKFLLMVYGNLDKVSLNRFSILSTLKTFLNSNSKTSNENLQTIKGLIKRYLNTDDLDNFYKLDFVVFLFENKGFIGLEAIDFTIEELKDYSLSIYKKIVSNWENKRWKTNDFRFYHAYGNICKFYLHEEVNYLFIEFWNKSNIDLLCSQMVKSQPFTARMLQTSDFVMKVFGTKQNYRNFVISIVGAKDLSESLKEYLEFLKVESFTDFKQPVLFIFKKFKKISSRVNQMMIDNNITVDDHEQMVEIFVESFSHEAFEATYTNVSSRKISELIDNETFQSDNKMYTRIRINRSIPHVSIKDAFSHYEDRLSKRYKSIETLKDPWKLLGNERKLIEIVSIQPKITE